MSGRALQRRRLRRRRFTLGLSLTLGLAFVAGMTDAIGLILVGRYVSFMSGNTTELGIALAGGSGSSAFFLFCILAAFVAGNALGEMAMRMSGRRHEILLMLVAGLTVAPVWLGAMPWGILPVVVGMGMLNAGLDQVDGHAFGVTFVTGALSRFGRGIGRWLMGERSTGWRYQITPWLGMLAGAVAGALAHRMMGEGALLAAALAVALLALLTLAIPRNWRVAYASPARR